MSVSLIGFSQADIFSAKVQASIEASDGGHDQWPCLRSEITDWIEREISRPDSGPGA